MITVLRRLRYLMTDACATHTAPDGWPYVPVRHKWVGGTRWKFMQWADIPDARDEQRTYLRRLRIVQTPWFAVYWHWIILPDEDRDPHDHPFAFWSLILKGGYSERLFRILPGERLGTHRPEEQHHQRGSVHKMPQSRAHMVTSLQPGTWTLVVAGPKTSDWGFYTPRFVGWKAYNEAKYGPEEYALDEYA